MQTIGSCMAKILFLEPCSVYGKWKKEKKKNDLDSSSVDTPVGGLVKCPVWRGVLISGVHVY